MQLNTKTAGRLHNQLVEIEKRTARLDVGQVFKKKKFYKPYENPQYHLVFGDNFCANLLVSTVIIFGQLFQMKT